MSSKDNSIAKVDRLVTNIRPSRGVLFGALILGALLAFEIFNYSTTDFALTDLLGDLRFASLRWATILALAFCAIDFAGIARLFTPEKSSGQPKEVWYLFGAWLLAATMNAMLTYWGVTLAILSHNSSGGSVLSQGTILKVVPVFVAILVWVIRVLIIGSFSMTGERLSGKSDWPQQDHPARRAVRPQPLPNPSLVTTQGAAFTPAPKAEPQSASTGHPRTEPTYHPISVSSATENPPRIHK